MKQNHKLKCRLIASILLTSLFLQSCGGFSNQLTPIVEEQAQNIPRSTEQIAIKQLVGQELMAEGGHLVTFREEGDKLKADIKMKAPVGFSKIYTGLEVAIASDVNLQQLVRLHPKKQRRCIHVQLSPSGRSGKVTLFEKGILGGMMEGEEGGKKITQQPTQRLTDITELRRYFYKGYLEITPGNYVKLIEFSQKNESLFMSYDGGICVKGWEMSKELGSLIDLLVIFSKVKKFKINCAREDGAEVAEFIIRAVQFYEELEELDLNGCQLDDVMIEDIMGSIAVPEKITMLNIIDNNFSTETLVQIGERFSNAQITTNNDVAQTRNTTRSVDRTTNSQTRSSSDFRQTPTRDTSSPSVSSRNSMEKSEMDSPFQENTAYDRLNLNRFLAAISAKEIECGQRLGAGGMGVVYEAIYQGKKVAVKKLLNTSEEQIASFQKEAIIMANHRHNNIVAFLGYCPEENALMMEYVSGGSLASLLKSSEEISWQVRYQIALDIVEGMSYLHDCGIVHADLKSENILLDSNRRAKVTDFGTSALKSENSTFGDWRGGTLRWMAPELFHTEKNTKAGDVYSYGMALWQLGARKEPFAGIVGFQVTKHIAAGNQEVVTEDTPLEIKQVIEQCWLPEPPLKKPTDTQNRPTMREVRRMLERCMEGKEKEKEKTSESKEKGELLNRLARLEKELDEERQKKKENKVEKEQEQKEIEKEWPQPNPIRSEIITGNESEEKATEVINVNKGDESKEKEKEKESRSQSELEEIIKRWNYGREILTQFKSISGTLDYTSQSLNADEVIVLTQHLRFKQIHTLKLRIRDSGVQELTKVLPSTQIHTLDLSYNQINDAKIQELAKALPHTQIHTLNLSYNELGNAGAQELAKALPSTKIRTLNLIHNKIGHAGAQELAKALPSTQIHMLDLWWNEIGDAGVQELAKALPSTQIHTLNLRNNEIGAAGAQELAKVLPSTQIHTLDLISNKLDDAGAQELANALPNTHIHTLYLGYTRIGNVGVQEFGKALPNTQIHTLDLSGNQIGVVGVQELAKALPSTQIHTLSLERNDIDAARVKELAKALPNTKIHTLDLKLNKIGDTEAQELAKGLPNTQIHILDLNENEIGSAGAKALAKVLPSTQIHTLKLGYNDIGNAGARELAKVLPNTKIHTLNLGSNKIGASGAKELAKALSKTQIHTLNLDGNKKISDKMQRLLREQNPKIKFSFYIHNDGPIDRVKEFLKF